MQKTNDQNARIMEALRKLQLSDSNDEEYSRSEASEAQSDKKDYNSSNTSMEESKNAILQSKYSKLKSDSNVLKENVNFANMPSKKIAIQRPTTSSSKQLPPPKKASLNVNNEKSFLKAGSRNNSQFERPKTSQGKENVRFQPVYTEAYNQFLITNKCFNYKDKKFITVAKKTDIVAKFQNFKKGWEKTKFLKNNSQNGKEGRKLNLAERICNDKPEEMFYRYVPKAGLY